ncbi:MAG: 50S ribosomal protein L21 [Deltaproteobacteria bacterium CG_4_8_14_3_um_filter_51_11]|nr:50S ribosomal protein L21 [bacterium]OIP37335.1 MAG: 50S ribosomal protein L21 [Desulfobacteraceae bacterium CG2_30_51_40]PIP47665.1 MAG: 50S ribosomal protein L21 [Deltaproteobacteria bacterium CG23_combo_of_CG06-09_8_20_14_all_51_20]PIX18978.1 MAG: 50S ribosomal protein L21 [Deltaproteobacteria bacterium CG_4_8_14_3_um_filter_51_11]PIY21857.1 MAG: 50S ribosomal protein L21 [Deltaproteobacteria bacterium CG_4_10_14_3_um_filter_51_14]PJB37739.1 MAG: 50S ribosomal protein L21 [Deltaproteobac
MYAVIKSGGNQYRVMPGDEIQVSKLPGEQGASVAFDQVMLTSDGDKIAVGTPYLEGTKVSGTITRQARTRKVVVFKYKRRKGYRRTKSHRQDFSQVRIDNIETLQAN